MELVLFTVFAALVTVGALVVIFFGDGRRRPAMDEGTMFSTASGQFRMFTPGDKVYYILGPGRPDWDSEV
jgi:hypothetical protein